MAENPEKMPDTGSNESESGQKSKKGWIENLALRSTGLPDERAPEVPEDRYGDNDKALWRLAGLGIQFAITVAIFAWMGHELDAWRGWSPWGLVTLSMMAVIGNLYLLIKEAIKDPPPPK